jgi:aspartate-semialdehyde dehydrogenase
VAIIGAGGVVGSEVVSLLEEQRVRIDDLRLFGTASSAGELYRVRGEEVEIQEYEPERLLGVELVILAVPGGYAKEVIPQISAEGVCIVDLTPAYRLDPNVSLIAPLIGIGGEYRPGAHLSIAGASAVQIAAVARALAKKGVVSEIVATTLQSVSDAGRDGLDELWGQSIAICNQRAFEGEVFGEQIAFNCIPLIGTVLPDGFTSEERLIAGEVRRLLASQGGADLWDSLPITTTAIRVPVFHGCGTSVCIEFANKVESEELFEALRGDPSLSLSHEAELPMHLSVIGQDSIQIGRVRYSHEGLESGGEQADVRGGRVSAWSVVDNVRAVGARAALSVIEDYVRSKRGGVMPQ